MHTCCCTKVYSKGLTQIPAIIKVHYNYIHKHLSVYLWYCSNLTSATPRYNHTHISMANRLHINYTILPCVINIVNGRLYNRHLCSLHAYVNMFQPQHPNQLVPRDDGHLPQEGVGKAQSIWAPDQRNQESLLHTIGLNLTLLQSVHHLSLVAMLSIWWS